LSSSEVPKELDNKVLLSTSKPIAKGDAKFCRPEGSVGGDTLLTSFSSLTETNTSDILAKKEHERAEADSSSSSSGSSSTRSSTQNSDIASQPDEDEEEIFEDASSVLADGMGEIVMCIYCVDGLAQLHTQTHAYINTCTDKHIHTQTHIL